MNSEEIPLNGILQEDPSSSNQIPTSDSNANLSHQNKGAIPKTKTSKPISVTKKPTKLNNNVEELLLPKSPNLTDDVLQLHSDVLRINGFTDTLSRLSTSYLDDYKSVIFGSSSDNCENCVLNKANGSLHENQFNNHDIYRNKDENDLNEPPCKIASYQPSCSRDLEVDVDLQLKIDSESSSSDNELLSISDDGCIYTYKGDHVADLPSSFFSLDIPPPRSPEAPPQNRQENASPEMDFLEMDFDPGPSGDADSDSQSNADLENTENLPQDPSYKVADVAENRTYVDNKSLNQEPAVYKKQNNEPETAKTNVNPITISEPLSVAGPSTSGFNICPPCVVKKQESPVSSVSERIRKLRMPWSCSLAERTTGHSSNRVTRRHHGTNGELTSPVERLSSPSEDFVIYDSTERPSYNNVNFEKVMIWSEHEASRKQITQIGASACGATAVLNVLNALRFPIPSIDKIREVVKTRLRANSSPLTEYLLSRSVAGSTHEDLIEGLNQITEGQVYARFFHMFPERVVNISLWLQFWIKHGAVPIATLNLQNCLGTIPDAWHHQMIFGVGPRGVYLTNPLECVDPGQLWPQLSSESILLIRREDVLSRWDVKTDLEQLMCIKDCRWGRINVVGQVANMVRENMREKRPGFANTSHIKIPAAYLSGITLVMRREAPLSLLLKYCPELPLVPTNDEAVGYCDTFY